MTVLKQSHDQPSGVQRQASDTDINYSKSSQWLQSGNEGLLLTASVMTAIGSLKEDSKAMIISGFAVLIAGSFSIAMRKFHYVYWEMGIEVAQMKRENTDMKEGNRKLHSTVQAALVSALAFLVGGMVPILAASFIKQHKVRLGVVAGAVTLALMVFGELVAKFGRSRLKMLVIGWLPMLVSFGLIKLFGSHLL